MTTENYTIGVAQPAPPHIVIQNPETSRFLLSINPDGTVTGDIEDASEAARVFVEHIRGMVAQTTQSDALREENERLREHLISALDTLKDAEVCDDNCGPCNEARAALQEQSK